MSCHLRFHVLLLVAVLIIERGVARRIEHRNGYSHHNDVIKRKPIPSVPSDTFEAYYYGLYDDPSDEFAGFDDRPGEADMETSCDTVQPVPLTLRQSENMAPLGLDDFYQKYSEAYGIPVVGSAKVADETIKRACYVLRFLLADRADLRHAFYSAHGRVAVIAAREDLTQLPEYWFLGREYDEATRGLGAVPVIPVSSAGEENILCDEDDMYLSEDILIRELAMGILKLAVPKAIPSTYRELVKHYNHAKRSGWWKNTYAMLSADSYFGEGVQSFFDVNGFSHGADGRHNEVSIRTRMRTYDSQLYNLVLRIFPCANHYIKRCNTRGHENHQKLKMDCSIPFRNRHRRRRGNKHRRNKSG